MERVRLAIVPTYLLLCLVLGGASAAGFLVNMGLQLLAIMLLFGALVVTRPTPLPSSARVPIVLVLLILALIAVQLVPLAPSIWSTFPGRERYAAAYRMLDVPDPDLSISLAPYLTIASALWLLPAFAVFVAALRPGWFKPAWLALVIVLVAVSSVMLGAVQVSSGGDTNSPAYFYKITNYGVAVGFFANANHLASLLVISLPFAGALYMHGLRRSRSAQKSPAMLLVTTGVIAVILIGIALNQSLAGIGLAVPAAAATYVMVRFAEKKTPVWALLALPLLALAAVLAIFKGPFGNDLTGSESSSPLARYSTFKNSIAAAGDFFPYGSGVGTFRDIYPSYEDPATVTRTYINHAHNDYIELVLETGVFGALLILVFLLWWLRRTINIWSAEARDGFACAATIASGAILVHSIVDYPLRTAAISAVFAACCALMAGARPATRPTTRSRKAQKQGRHLSAD